ncbi:probable metalloprotease ARX1 [Kluyveromyces marxianus]|uniref:Probable metalloprotease ARX1 n=2 Tax=Kluyveromyces marxianus TaxID=4911 RepID=W0T740_KLUMD|nr:probable metalloprotease ARX1 [Kluyveromyces marxianus DMKU3-1042]QGN14370.1 putative metalloprotease ARX1 [Kluyveromyces marxianus]BAO38631.1 probable metalloprotease ARX1 [Kluyveromyces marxianus DMKU3-1042]BAP70179.1 probable metalloprotease ARX1 [Kluyveromyces marxianus]
MSLQISKEDTQVLLKDKNVLNEPTVEKYRTAGQIAQTGLRFLINMINKMYHEKSAAPLPIHQLCLLTDSFIAECLSTKFNNKVNEKGISMPTCIDVDEINENWCPEVDDIENLQHWNQKSRNSKSIEKCNGVNSSLAGFLKVGDVAKITVGCHIDGYTCNLSHSMVIYPTVQDAASGQTVPEAALLGGKADALAATHIAVETVTNLLACANDLTKLPADFNASQVTGSLIRVVVDTIAQSYNCCVVPGSRVRRIKRFLSGQNENIIVERDFKGVIWTESHQESSMLAKTVDETAVDIKRKNPFITEDTVVPTDDFVVAKGEVYMIDLKLAPLQGLEPGLITLQTVDQFSGKSESADLIARPGAICRDFSRTHILKLRSSRQLLARLDKQGVYPTKLAHVADSFPLDTQEPDFESIKQELKPFRLGLSELANNYLTFNRDITIVKHVPWAKILELTNPAGVSSYDAMAKHKGLYPGFELPLPKLGLSNLQLKSLLKKHSSPVPVVRQCITVAICDEELLRISGKLKPNWVHSVYSMDATNNIVAGIFKLAQLSEDKRFGLKIRETQPWKMKN